MGRLDNQVHLCLSPGMHAAMNPRPPTPCYMVECAPQVKLRGFRVELGEIEAALTEAPGVKLGAVVVLHDPAGAQQLVAYVTPESADTAAVLASLKGRLPVHMVPSVVMRLPAMPLSPAGKIDHKALPKPDWGDFIAGEYEAPANDLQRKLQAIWHEVLGQERVSTQADFFAIGGNSLQVITLMCWTMLRTCVPVARSL